jgi:hypothetical protein
VLIGNVDKLEGNTGSASSGGITSGWGARAMYIHTSIHNVWRVLLDEGLLTISLSCSELTWR